MKTDLESVIENLRIEQMGCAGMIPGLQRSLDCIQAEIDNLRKRMFRAQEGLANATAQLAGFTPNGKHGKTANLLLPASEDRARRSKKSKGYWAGMTREERSAEMRRRMRVAGGDAPSAKTVKLKKRLHPRDAAHPDHGKWLDMMRNAQKKRWQGLSVKQKREQQARMQGARAAKAALAGKVGRVNGEARA